MIDEARVHAEIMADHFVECLADADCKAIDTENRVREEMAKVKALHEAALLDTSVSAIHAFYLLGALTALNFALGEPENLPSIEAEEIW